MPIQIIDGFKIKDSIPVDDRLVKSGLNQRDSISYKYPGLRTFDLSDQIPYVWIGSKWQKESLDSVLFYSKSTVGWTQSIFNGITVTASNLLKVWNKETNELINSSIVESIYRSKSTLGLNFNGKLPDFNYTLDVNGDVTSQKLVGTGSNLTDLNASNISSGSLSASFIKPIVSEQILHTYNNQTRWVFGSSMTLDTIKVSLGSTGSILLANSDLTTSNKIYGTGSFIYDNGQILSLKDSSANTPCYSFYGNTNTGFYYNNGIIFAVNGDDKLKIDNKGIKVPYKVSIRFFDDPNWVITPETPVIYGSSDGKIAFELSTTSGQSLGIYKDRINIKYIQSDTNSIKYDIDNSKIDNSKKFIFMTDSVNKLTLNNDQCNIIYESAKLYGKAFSINKQLSTSFNSSNDFLLNSLNTTKFNATSAIPYSFNAGPTYSTTLLESSLNIIRIFDDGNVVNLLKLEFDKFTSSSGFSTTNSIYAGNMTAISTISPGGIGINWTDSPRRINLACVVSKGDSVNSSGLSPYVFSYPPTNNTYTQLPSNAFGGLTFSFSRNLAESTSNWTWPANGWKNKCHSLLVKVPNPNSSRNRLFYSIHCNDEIDNKVLDVCKLLSKTATQTIYPAGTLNTWDNFHFGSQPNSSDGIRLTRAFGNTNTTYIKFQLFSDPTYYVEFLITLTQDDKIIETFYGLHDTTFSPQVYTLKTFENGVDLTGNWKILVRFHKDTFTINNQPDNFDIHFASKSYVKVSVASLGNGGGAIERNAITGWGSKVQLKNGFLGDLSGWINYPSLPSRLPSTTYLTKLLNGDFKINVDFSAINSYDNFTKAILLNYYNKLIINYNIALIEGT